MNAKNAKFAAAILVILGVMGVLLYKTTSDTSVYYLKPSELNSKAKKDKTFYQDRVRIGGLIVNEKIKVSNIGRQVKFYLTDERGDVQKQLVMVNLKQLKPNEILKVHYKGNEAVPDTFKAGGMAIVEGVFGKDGTFEADKLLAKCPSKYESKDKPDKKT